MHTNTLTTIHADCGSGGLPDVERGCCCGGGAVGGFLRGCGEGETDWLRSCSGGGCGTAGSSVPSTMLTVNSKGSLRSVAKLASACCVRGV